MRPLPARVVAAALVPLALVSAVAPARRAHAAGADPALAAAVSSANQAAAELARAESDLVGLEAEITRLRGEAEAGKARLGELQATLRQVAVSRYVGSGEVLPLGLGDDDLDHQAWGLALARQTTSGLAGELTRYRAAKAELDQDAAELEERQHQQRTSVDLLRQRHQEVVDQILRLDRLGRGDRSWSKLLTGPSLPAPHTVLGPGAGSGWVCPVQGPVAFADTWGAARSGGRRHQGTDLLAGRGTPVVAPVSGHVTHRANSLGGLSFHLDGSDGTTYYGAHLSGYGAAGDVAAGTIVGYVGDSGNARGITHLHFEVQPGGGPSINPYPIVSQHC